MQTSRMIEEIEKDVRYHVLARIVERSDGHLQFFGYLEARDGWSEIKESGLYSHLDDARRDADAWAEYMSSEE